MSELRGRLGVERLCTRLGAFMEDVNNDNRDAEVGGDGGSDANTMQTRSGGVLLPGMLDKTTELTLVDPLEEWATWDWKAIFATCQDGTKELEWVSMCAVNSDV